ncbi:hypothetical protein GN956_G19919 [Arapaima gigas]
MDFQLMRAVRRTAHVTCPRPGRPTSNHLPPRGSRRKNKTSVPRTKEQAASARRQRLPRPGAWDGVPALVCSARNSLGRNSKGDGHKRAARR